jgi:hypothetical protein
MKFKHRPSPALVVACIALLVALGGTSIAAVNALPRNSVGTAQLKNGAVVSSKVKDGSLKATDFASGQLQPGPAGPPGPPGAAGAAGPPGPGAKWALVNASGALVAQAGNVSITSHVGPGTYVLDFGEAVNNKLIIGAASAATAGLRGDVIVMPCGGPPAGFAACSVGGDNNHVAVFTSNAANTALADQAFYVAVIG